MRIRRRASQEYPFGELAAHIHYGADSGGKMCGCSCSCHDLVDRVCFGNCSDEAVANSGYCNANGGSADSFADIGPQDLSEDIKWLAGGGSYPVVLFALWIDCNDLDINRAEVNAQLP